MTKASLAVYGAWSTLIVSINDYEGGSYLETRKPTDKEIRAWIREKSPPQVSPGAALIE